MVLIGLLCRRCDAMASNAYFEVRGIWQHAGAAKLEIVRRLYFKELDGPHTEIIDSTSVKEIKDSGLEALLDSVVSSRLKGAHLQNWVDPHPLWDLSWKLHGSKISASLDLFATPWSPIRIGSFSSENLIDDRQWTTQRASEMLQSCKRCLVMANTHARS